ncbi:MAG TPA: sterol desaturase family protein [Rhizobiaceae bacterium]|nr:sterol desaturase family protein [Rhizobiaceae bacterium]
MHLGRLGYYLDFFVYPLLIAGLATAGIMRGGPEKVPEWLLFFVGSIILWTFVEYLLHRFGLHRIPYIREMHDYHHSDERALVGTPLWLSLIGHMACFLPIWLLFGFASASAVSCGLMLGYLWYIGVHHAVHHWHPRHGSYLYGLKRRHALHHHFDETGNFGVSSNFWDMIFGTLLPERAPKKNAS